MKHSRRLFRYCPLCSKKLTKNKDGYQSCSCGFIDYQNSRPAATALIFNEKKELLLGKRSMSPSEGKWNLIGGFLNRDEDPIVGIIREAKEETGLDIAINGFICINVGNYNDPIQGFLSTFNVYYSAKIIGGKMRASGEACELKFFSLNQLPEIAFSHDKKAVELLINKPI